MKSDVQITIIGAGSGPWPRDMVPIAALAWTTDEWLANPHNERLARIMGLQ